MNRSLDELPNSALKSAGAQARRRLTQRYAYMRDVSEAIHLDCVDDGDSIQAWTSATTSIRRRNCRTSAVTAWQNVKLKTCFDGPWKIDRGVKDRGSLWVGPRLGGIFA